MKEIREVYMAIEIVIVSKGVEIIQTKFYRKFLGYKYHLIGELGRYPMYVQRKFIMIKQWFKILNLLSNTTALHDTPMAGCR